MPKMTSSFLDEAKYENENAAEAFNRKVHI